MKVVFLDWDGVINTAKSRADYFDFESIDMACLKRVSEICKYTGAKVVITSTWRKLYSQEQFAYSLDLEGLEYPLEVIGMTPVSVKNRQRGFEIEVWLRDYSARFEDDIQFVILDDDVDMGNLVGHLVRTDGEVGLSDENVMEAIAMLRSKPSR